MVGAAQGFVVKIVVTGAAGQLGTELVDAVTAAGHDVRGLTRAQLDVTDDQAVRAVMAREKPNVIIHAAAWTAVDACEGDRDKAFLCNATATEYVVRAAREVGARVVYISTDYVFDGDKATPYVETDVPNPKSVYGASKLAGEQAVDLSTDAIVRISWVCGFHGANMVKTILRLAAQHETLTFVDDQIGNPTMADDAARMIVRLAIEQRRGIWHVTNQGVASWYEFTREVMTAAGLDPARVRPVKTKDLLPARPAPRPANSVLDNKALRDVNVTLLDDFRIPLSRLVQRLRLG
ncbi:MAG: dTDP-4-dehydrorhamnose reductase [Actinomycetota bacterium]